MYQITFQIQYCYYKIINNSLYFYKKESDVHSAPASSDISVSCVCDDEADLAGIMSTITSYNFVN